MIFLHSQLLLPSPPSPRQHFALGVPNAKVGLRITARSEGYFFGLAQVLLMPFPLSAAHSLNFLEYNYKSALSKEFFFFLLLLLLGSAVGCLNRTALNFAVTAKRLNLLSKLIWNKNIW